MLGLALPRKSRPADPMVMVPPPRMVLLPPLTERCSHISLALYSTRLVQPGLNVAVGDMVEVTHHGPGPRPPPAEPRLDAVIDGEVAEVGGVAADCRGVRELQGPRAGALDGERHRAAAAGQRTQLQNGGPG